MKVEPLTKFKLGVVINYDSIDSLATHLPENQKLLKKMKTQNKREFRDLGVNKRRMLIEILCIDKKDGRNGWMESKGGVEI